jgi:hypothetical protein
MIKTLRKQEERAMKATSIDHLDLMEHLAIAAARQQRDQYLQQLGALLASLEDAPPSSPKTMRDLFAMHESSGLPSLSSAIEAMREAR